MSITNTDNETQRSRVSREIRLDSIEEVEYYLKRYVEPGMIHEEWDRVCSAVHYIGEGKPEWKEMFIRWSEGSSSHNNFEMKGQVNSMWGSKTRGEGEKEEKVGYPTLKNFILDGIIDYDSFEPYQETPEFKEKAAFDFDALFISQAELRQWASKYEDSYLVKDIICAPITLIVARPKRGKSSLLFSLFHEITRQQRAGEELSFLGMPCNPIVADYLTEQPRLSLNRLLEKDGIDTDKDVVRFLPHGDVGSISIEQICDHYRTKMRAMREQDRPNLLVIDTATDWKLTMGETNNNDKVSEGISHLKELVNEFPTLHVVIVHQLGTNGDVLGATTMEADVDNIITMTGREGFTERKLKFRGRTSQFDDIALDFHNGKYVRDMFTSKKKKLTIKDVIMEYFEIYNEGTINDFIDFFDAHNYIDNTPDHKTLSNNANELAKKGKIGKEKKGAKNIYTVIEEN